MDGVRHGVQQLVVGGRGRRRSIETERWRETLARLPILLGSWKKDLSMPASNASSRSAHSTADRAMVPLFSQSYCRSPRDWANSSSRVPSLAIRRPLAARSHLGLIILTDTAPLVLYTV